MRIRQVLVLTAIVATLPGVSSAQLRVEPQIGVLFGHDLGRGQVSDLNGTLVGDAHFARNPAVILGLRVAYPLSRRVTVVASYASAAPALSVDVEPSGPGASSGFDQHLKFLFLSTQASLQLTPVESALNLAASAGAARVGLGDGRFSLDGWWGGVLGVTGGYRLNPAAAITATQELYVYNTDLGQKRAHALRMGLSLTPWH